MVLRQGACVGDAVGAWRAVNAAAAAEGLDAASHLWLMQSEIAAQTGGWEVLNQQHSIRHGKLCEAASADDTNSASGRVLNERSRCASEAPAALGVGRAQSRSFCSWQARRLQRLVHC